MEGQSKKVNLLMAMHCHQPVSNFAGIFQDAFEKAYLPFLDVFEEFANIKISLHYSGSLLDWLIQKHPRFIDRLKFLVNENRIEIIGGGYFEPILAIIPQKDAVGQIVMFKERIKEVFGCDCKGAWLAERVWEPKLPSILADTGIDWTIVDDYHFKISGMDPEKLNGYYLSEEESKRISIFPGSEKLRYLMPFRMPYETVDYLRNRLNSMQGDLTIAFADDGEKFGLWPETHKWVYREKWLKNFFTALEENKDWINTTTFSEFTNRFGPAGRIYLPCASYREMQEWSGGFFRNFFIKYPEANNMQKKMFFVSAKLNEAEEKHSLHKNTLSLIRNHLYRAQFNDAYWHGIFGGLYLNHLRSGVYEYLIKAENLIDDLEKQYDKVVQYDFDKDGRDELIISNKKMRLCLKPSEGATILEWDDKARCLNLTNTIARRPEHYHKQLKEKLQNQNQGAEPSSIHDKRPVRETQLDKFLFYDKYPRYSLRDYLLNSDTTLGDFYKSEFKEIVKLGSGAYEFLDKSKDKKRIIEFSRKEVIELCVVKVNKIISVADNLITVDYCLENFGIKNLNFIFGTDFNLSIYDSQFCAEPGEEEGVSKFTLNDLWKEAKLEFSLKPNAKVWYFPVETVSDSELGIEKTYQELCIFFNWQVTLNANSKLEFRLGVKLI